MKFDLPLSKPLAAFAFCSAAFLLQPIPQASASPLAPGGGIFAPGESDPVSATTLFTTNVAWTSQTAAFSGTLTSSVLQNDANNSLGGLTFTYELTLDSSSQIQASHLAIGGFAGFLTDVSYQTPASGVVPLIVARQSDGNTVDFNFQPLSPFGGAYISPGEYSALLVIQTDASTWSFSNASIQDHVASSTVFTLAPTDALNPVPEPSAAALALLGLVSAFYLRQTKPVHA